MALRRFGSGVCSVCLKDVHWMKGALFPVTKASRSARLRLTFDQHPTSYSNGVNNETVKLQHPVKSQKDTEECLPDKKQNGGELENLHNELSKQTVAEKYYHLYEGITEIHTKPALPSRSFNLAAYVNSSETLKNLILLGVDLSKVEKKPEEADYIIKMDFEKDIKPYLRFLHDVGVTDDELGSLLTNNPGILREDLDHLQVRINYLVSKKFSAEAIARIVSRAPGVLSMTTKELDKQLGYFQKEFRLTGDQVRYVITRYPKLTTASLDIVTDMKFHLKEFMGYTEGEMKHLFLECPRLYLRGRKTVTERFSYVYNDMEISADEILKWPSILSTRLHIIRQRHLFLRHLQRDQFDPKKPNFVSLKSLVTGTDAEFCQNVAKASVAEYNDFMKLL